MYELEPCLNNAYRARLRHATSSFERLLGFWKKNAKISPLGHLLALFLLRTLLHNRFLRRSRETYKNRVLYETGVFEMARGVMKLRRTILFLKSKIKTATDRVYSVSVAVFNLLKRYGRLLTSRIVIAIQRYFMSSSLSNTNPKGSECGYFRKIHLKSEISSFHDVKQGVAMFHGNVTHSKARLSNDCLSVHTDFFQETIALPRSMALVHSSGKTASCLSFLLCASKIDHGQSVLS